MKKTAKQKSSKGKASELPELVTVMMQVAQRLEALEKKMDSVVSSTSTHASELTRLRMLCASHPNATRPHEVRPQPQERRDRPLFHAVCADCGDDCEVPFKPSEGRKIYCKKCFARHRAQPQPQLAAPSTFSFQSSMPTVPLTKMEVDPPKKKKQKPAKKAKKKK